MNRVAIELSTQVKSVSDRVGKDRQNLLRFKRKTALPSSRGTISRLPEPERWILQKVEFLTVLVTMPTI